MKIRDRIVKVIKAKASSVRPCPWNWRVHPDKQKEALDGILEEVGFAGALLVRPLKDGSYMLIDGHLRQGRMGDTKVTLLVTDLTEKEHKKLLAAYDPIAAMAETDKEALGKLLKELETGSAGLATLFSDLAEGSEALDPKELELDVEDDDEEEEGDAGDPANLPSSHVRMVQLFLNNENLPDFEKMVAFLGKKFKTTNLTDTVFKAVRYAYKNHKTEKAASR